MSLCVQDDVRPVNHNLSGMRVFISWDGDHIGREIGRKSLVDDVEGVRRTSQAIDHGNKIWESWVLRSGGSIVSFGGDEGRAEVEADRLSELPDIRNQYAEAVGSPVSVGVGLKMSEADKALLAAKLKGGNNILFYSQEVDEILEHARQQGERTEENKIADEYLGKADPALNQGAGAGMRGQSPAHPAAHAISPRAEASEHSEGEGIKHMLQHEESEQPPAPEMAHAAQDFEDQFHGHAQNQDDLDAQAAQSQEDRHDDIREQVGKVLQEVRGRSSELEAIRQTSPETYKAIVDLVQAVIAMGKEVVGVSDEAMEKAEKFDELEYGTQLEMEHTKDRNVARKIAQDHLAEDPHYYSKLRECMPEKKRELEPEKPVEDSKELEKVALPSAHVPPAHHHVVLPPGSQDGPYIKVLHSDGKTSWKEMRSGMILSQDPAMHPTSSRSPGSR